MISNGTRQPISALLRAAVTRQHLIYAAHSEGAAIWDILLAGADEGRGRERIGVVRPALVQRDHPEDAGKRKLHNEHETVLHLGGSAGALQYRLQVAEDVDFIRL